jgi:hypothetical protein
MKLRHPITAAEYELLEDGSVRVVDTEGREGRFDATGRHLEGELRTADPHIVDWVAMKKLPSRRQLTADD